MSTAVCNQNIHKSFYLQTVCCLKLCMLFVTFEQFVFGRCTCYLLPSNSLLSEGVHVICYLRTVCCRKVCMLFEKSQPRGEATQNIAILVMYKLYLNWTVGKTDLFGYWISRMKLLQIILDFQIVRDIYSISRNWSLSIPPGKIRKGGIEWDHWHGMG